MRRHAKVLFAIAALASFFAFAGSAAAACPNEAFRTGVAAQLPDCRAYEMVSPPFKNGTDVVGMIRNSTSSAIRSSVTGDRVAFSSEGIFAGNGSSFIYSSYLSGRDAQGWDTGGLGLPTEYMPVVQASSNAIRGFSRDLRYSILVKVDPPLTEDATPKTLNLFRRDNFDGSVVKLSPVGQTRTDPAGSGASFAAGSEDFSHIIFESKLAMAPGAVSGAANLYEWANGETRLVGVLPNGEPAGAGSVAGPFSQFIGGTYGASYLETAMSRDGSRIVWTDLATKQLYLRIDGTTSVHVSASQRTNDSGPGGTDPEGPRPATWRYSTPDGSVVYFTSAEKLTNDSTASTTNGLTPVEGSPDLYAYHVESGQLEDLSVSPEPGLPADVQGMLGASDDGEYVYFVAGGVLAPGAVAAPEKANLYLWHAGEVQHIATLGGAGGNTIESFNWQNDAYNKVKSSRVTSDGRVAIFRSKERLTPYDNAGFFQVYRYDAAADELTCVSCNPRTVASTADAEVSVPTLSGPSYDTFLDRILSADGSRVFFNTREAIAPQDTNGQFDVYRWEDGEARLISTGQSSAPSYFAEASASGDDAFFVTRERLLPADIDDNLDLYDARVGGGFAQAEGAGGCQGEDCQPAGPSTPPATAPGSSAVGGRGNAKPRRVRHARCAKARKGKAKASARAKPRCAKKHQAKKKRAANHRRGGAK